MRKLLLIYALALAGLGAGCQLWNPGGTPATAKNGAFTITAPAGWMYATSLGPDLLASRGYTIVPLATAEIAKVDAGLSCMSLRWTAA